MFRNNRIKISNDIKKNFYCKAEKELNLQKRETFKGQHGVAYLRLAFVKHVFLFVTYLSMFSFLLLN